MPTRKRARIRKEKGAAATPPEDEHDHLSALPDDPLNHILSFVPAQDVVRTCVLSRRWRHLWKSTRALHIITPGSIEEIREFMDHLLLLRAGSPIDSFELMTCEGMSEADIPRVNLWIRHAVACQAQVLQLEVFGSRTWLILEDLHAVFASKHLTRLEFAFVEFSDNILNFSSCPALQDLRIRNCGLSSTKRILSQSLKHLRIAICNSSQTLRTRICTPNLISLCLDGAFERAPVLETMPSLVDAAVGTGIRCTHICSDWCRHSTSGNCGDLDCKGCSDIEQDDSCVLLQGLSAAKNLVLVALPRTFIFRRDLKCCPTFHHLKNLLLNEYWCVPDVCALACILEHSPVLEKLTLHLFSEGPKHGLEIKVSPNPKEISTPISQHLKIVEIKCEAVDETVLKFLSKLNLGSNFEE